MPNNFKLTGDYYVSIDGSDSNSGLTKDAPKRTIQAALTLATATKTIVIGAGLYKEALSKSATTTLTIIGDGIVVLEAPAPNSEIILTGSVGYYYFQSIEFRNYYSMRNASSAGWATQLTFTNCIIKNINVNLNSSATGTFTFYTNCLLINVNDYTPGILYLNNNICVNTNLLTDSATILKDSFFSSSCLINSAASITAANFNYNNIQGSIIMNVATTVTTGTYQDIYGRYYDLSQAGTNPSGDGSLSQPFYRAQTSGVAFSYTNHRLLYSTMNANSMSVDPQFNNIQAQDFTLQATSPMIGRASDGINNIGGTKYAVRHASNGAVFLADAISVTDLNFIGNDYVVTSPATSGQVVGAPIQLGTSLKVVQKISYNGLLEFNKALGAGPVVGNRNVPDNYVYGTGTQGANPDRLVYEIRYSTQVTEPATSGEWDNGGYITAGDYFTMEWNTKPSFDTAFIGNGGATFNAADTPTYLNATWIQLKIVLRNNYV